MSALLLNIQPGDEVPIGTVIAIIRSDGEETSSVEMTAAITEPAPVVPVPPQPEAPPPAVRLHISPLARKLADELGIDPAKVKGTGPGGRITREDVEKTAQPKAVKTASQTGMRQIIAAAMTRAKREIPHYYLRTTIDLKRALDWLAQENAKRNRAQIRHFF